MSKIKRIVNYFTITEKLLWLVSCSMLLISFLMSDRTGVFNLIASLIGATSIIFNAKGNPCGQVLMIVFSITYGITSYHCAFYGEMITYLGMTMPMAFLALISWLKNPYKGNHAEVSVNRLKKGEPLFLALLSIFVTVIFYFILKYFNTANLIPGTFSVLTSFLAVFLTYRRSPWFAFAYALNDMVLILLWILASMDDPSYISMVVCFAAFLFNDFYCFIRWNKMKARQALQ